MVTNIKFSGWKPFTGIITDDSTDDDFEDDEVLGDGVAATHYLTLTMGQIYWIEVRKIMYYMEPTNNAETYTLVLLSNDDEVEIEEYPRLIYQSPAARADSVLYMETGGASNKVPVLARLPTGSRIWFKLDWSGAPGETTGFILVEGMALV